MTRTLWLRLGAILLLLLLPFVMFMGESSRVVDNGRVIVDRSINYLGILLAAVGLFMAATTIFRRSLEDRLDGEPTPRPARLFAALLALLCAGQVAIQFDVVRIRDRQDAIALWYDVHGSVSERIALWRGLQPPPADIWPGLSQESAEEYRTIGENDSEPELRRLMAISHGVARVQVERHNAYADACFDGRHRLPEMAIPPMPPRFGATEMNLIALVRETNYNRSPPQRCSNAATAAEMTERAQEASLFRDGLALLTEAYLRRFGPGP